MSGSRNRTPVKEEAVDWRYGGSALIESEGRVSLPEKLRETGLLSAGSDGYWGYEIESERLVLAAAEPVGRCVKSVGSRTVGRAGDSYRLTIPFQFFDNSGETLSQQVQRAGISADISLSKGDTILHFVYPHGDDGSPRWCYLLTPSQFDDWLRLPTEVAAITVAESSRIDRRVVSGAATE